MLVPLSTTSHPRSLYFGGIYLCSLSKSDCPLEYIVYSIHNIIVWYQPSRIVSKRVLVLTISRKRKKVQRNYLFGDVKPYKRLSRWRQFDWITAHNMERFATCLCFFDIADYISHWFLYSFFLPQIIVEWLNSKKEQKIRS